MVLTAEQHLKIALLYEKAAADRLGVPPQQRAAFTRKAKWFRMKARITAKKEAATGLSPRLLEDGHINGAAHPSPMHGCEHAQPEKARLEEARLEKACLDEARLEEAPLVELPGAAETAHAKPRYRSIAERLKVARAVLG